MSKRKQGFPLSKRFNNFLWKVWDSLTPKEREDYEVYYEGRDNTIGRYRIPFKYDKET